MSKRLANQTVVVVGLGLTGQSCVRYLLSQGAEVIGMDSRDTLDLDLTIPVFLGALSAKPLLAADMVVLSPGVDPKEPAIAATIDSGVEVIGDVELFARANRRPVVAITGSNGKSTVTMLVADMLNEAGFAALTGGNIGTPVLDLLEQPGDILVLELSSFQLETISSLQPKVAAMLNLSDDHLDRHGTLERYREAKQRIFACASHKVVNRDDTATWTQGQDNHFSFGLSPSEQGFSWNADTQNILFNQLPWLDMSECQLSGTHNVLNIQAAAACAMAVSDNHQAFKQAARAFSGLAHRFETVSDWGQIRWINDSKATNVGATVAAISGLAGTLKGQLILIAGGVGKGADFSPLHDVFSLHVSLVIALGRDGDKIAQQASRSIKAASMQDAVRTAFEHASPGDVVLLSPACASLDMFDNYQVRGDSFRQAVRELAA